MPKSECVPAAATFSIQGEICNIRYSLGAFYVHGNAVPMPCGVARPHTPAAYRFTPRFDCIAQRCLPPFHFELRRYDNVWTQRRLPLLLHYPIHISSQVSLIVFLKSLHGYMRSGLRHTGWKRCRVVSTARLPLYHSH